MYILKTLQEENVHSNSLMGLKVWWSWGSRIFFSKSPKVGRFSIFHAKLQILKGGFSFFWSSFCRFFGIFSSKTWVFSGAGWSFWVKMTLFLLQNFSFCGAGCSFWYVFCLFFVIFLKCAPPPQWTGFSRRSSANSRECWQPVHPSRWLAKPRELQPLSSSVARYEVRLWSPTPVDRLQPA